MYRSFDEYDRDCIREEKNRPHCVSCGQPIWEEKALCIDGNWYCDECEDEFFAVIRKEYTEHIEECA